MSPSLQKLVDDAKDEAAKLHVLLRAIKAHPEAKVTIICTGDGDTEILANECEHLGMFIEPIADWEVQ